MDGEERWGYPKMNSALTTNHVCQNGGEHKNGQHNTLKLCKIRYLDYYARLSCNTITTI